MIGKRIHICKFIGLIISLLLLSFSYNLYSQTDKIGQLFKDIDNAKDQIEKINRMNELCWELRNYNIQKALEYGEEALNLSKLSHYNTGAVNAYINMAYIYIKCKQYEKATEYYLVALKTINEKNNNKKTKANMARIYEGIGLINYSQGDYNKAIDYYNKALKIFTEISEKTKMSSCYKILGHIYEKLGDKGKASEYYYNEMKNQLRNKKSKNKETTGYTSGFQTIAIF